MDKFFAKVKDWFSDIKTNRTKQILTAVAVFLVIATVANLVK